MTLRTLSVTLRLLISFVAVLAVPAIAAPQQTIRWRAPGLGSSALPTAQEMRDVMQQMAASPDARHFVVQFDKPITKHTRERMEAYGVTLLRPLGASAYFAVLSPSRLQASAVAGVRGLVDVQEIRPLQRLHPQLADGDVPPWSIVTAGEGAPPTVAAYLLLHADVALERGSDIVAGFDGTVVDTLESINGLVIEISHVNLLALATVDEVQWIEPPLPRMSAVNDSNRVAIQADQVQGAPYNLDGSGVTVMVYDGGSGRASHADFGGRLTVRDTSGLSNHSTHVAGTVGGDGAASGGTNRGMAPGVIIESYGFEYDGTGIFLYTNPGDLESDYNQAINTYGVDIANNSIGTNTEPNGFPCDIQGDYGVTANLIDAIVGGSLGTPFRIVWANGNERQGSTCDIEGFGDYYSTAPPACAKNHITVGAANSNNDTMTSFSSWGPTDDGRLKPDISGPGCQSSGDGGVTSTGSASNTAYSTLCGTSMAAPSVTGSLALLIEDYRVQFPATSDPLNSTLKALLAQTAADQGNAGPDYQFGYGTVRIKDAIDRMRLGTFREDTLDHQGGSYVYTVTVNPGDDLKLTLAWDDVPGTPNVFGALVNDLDLIVTDPGGGQQFPWTLDPANPSTSAVKTVADHLNNMEQVDVPSAQAGTWTVEVFGYDVPSGPQTFSLVSSHTLTVGPSVQISFVSSLPTNLMPGAAETVTAQVIGINDTVVGGSPTLHVRYDGGSYLALPMTSIGGDQYQADLPPAVCGATPEFYFTAQGTSSGTATNPAGAPTTTFQSTVQSVTTIFADDFETDQGWTVQNVALTDGPWERGVPAGLGDRCDPMLDFDGSGQCYLTDNVAGNSDVDGGPTQLTSPTLDLSGTSDPTVRYARWFCNNAFDIDRFDVEISSNGGANWTTVESVGYTGGWTTHSFRVSDFVTPTSTVVLRFSATDNPNDSVTEAALDAVLIQDGACSTVLDDCNANGILDSDDIASGRSADANTNGIPDECESNDCDNDGIPDNLEPDCDSDGLPDDCEIDCNANGTPDDCESLVDCNANGTPDVCESFTDCNTNGVPDECEPDCDSDGLPDDCEIDCNANGTPDDCESLVDCNANGTPDVCESFTDCNTNGVPDECEPDCDSDGMPDDCETDCNTNGTPDDCEALADCNANGTPDVCESFADCNANGVPDECEVDCNSNGTPDDCESFSDCNANSVPDECDPDCNANGTPDDCETLVDCNLNGTPDECETFADCNSNGVPDECDPDCDSDGTPDDCEVDCNANGTPDDCESFTDCNNNGVPDDCDPDGNGNGIPDDCEGVDVVANGEIPAQGTVAGTFVNTQVGDSVTESILEEVTNGNPSKRRSRLEHRWTFTVPSATSVDFFIRAHHTPNSEGDDFIFAWSTDNSVFTNLLTVVKTADDGMYQSASLPPSVSGTLYIRVLDADRTQGSSVQDTVFVDHMYIRTSSTPAPPLPPTGLTATAVSTSQIDLTWNDNSGNEDGFEIERSTDGVSFGLLASAGPGVTSYADTGLAASTTYFYRVRAFNGIGSSAYSNVASDTTLNPGAADAVANGETSVSGSITVGSYLSTQAGDGVYEEIREDRTGGKPADRVSFMEHKWTFNVSSGSSVEFNVRAHHTANSEGDDFVFAWSTDDSTYFDLVTVTKTADDGSYQTAALPPSVSGNVFIRVLDTDRTLGNGNRDTVFVDHMFIRTQ